jgi:hypothetical protein
MEALFKGKLCLQRRSTVFTCVGGSEMHVHEKGS